MRNWKQYKNKTYTQQKARKMDYELDIVHDLLTQLYDDDNWTERVRETLDKINRVVHSKSDLRESGYKTTAELTDEEVDKIINQ